MISYAANSLIAVEFEVKCCHCHHGTTGDWTSIAPEWLRKRRRESASKSWRNPRHTVRFTTSHIHVPEHVCTYYYVLVCVLYWRHLITIDALYNAFLYLLKYLPHEA